MALVLECVVNWLKLLGREAISFSVANIMSFTNSSNDLYCNRNDFAHRSFLCLVRDHIENWQGLLLHVIDHIRGVAALSQPAFAYLDLWVVVL